MDQTITPYFAWLLAFLIIPIAVLAIGAHSLLWKFRKVYIRTIAVSLAFGIPWDYYAIKTQIWGWDGHCCSLPRITGIPLEEIIFGVLAAILVTSTTLVIRDIYQNHQKAGRR